MSWNRSNNNVMGESGRRRCNNDDVLGDRGRNECECRCRCNNSGVSPEIAIRGPGCISGTGRCGEFTASFVETNGRPAEGYCGQVSPAGNMQHQRCNRNNNVAGETGRRRCDEEDDVLGESGRRPWQNVRGRCNGNVAGESGRRRCEEVESDTGRRRCDCDCFERCLIELLEDILDEFGEDDNHCNHR